MVLPARYNRHEVAQALFGVMLFPLLPVLIFLSGELSIISLKCRRMACPEAFMAMSITASAAAGGC